MTFGKVEQILTLFPPIVKLFSQNKDMYYRHKINDTL